MLADASFHYRILQQTAAHCKTHCKTPQHTAAHCNTLHHIAAHCNTLQHTHLLYVSRFQFSLQHIAAHCDTLHHTAAHCNTLQHTMTHSFTVCWQVPVFKGGGECGIDNIRTLCVGVSPHFSENHMRTITCAFLCLPTFQRFVFALLRAKSYSHDIVPLYCNTLQHTATHCNTLQHTATHCNTLQHTATHCSALQLQIKYSQSHLGCHFRKLKAQSSNSLSLLPRFREKRRSSFEL